MNTISKTIIHYLLLSVTTSYCIGIVIGSYFYSYLPTVPLIFITLITVFTSLFIKQKTVTSYLICCSFLLFGMFAITEHSKAPTDQNHIFNIIEEETDCVVTGILHEMPTTFDDHAKILLSLKSIRFEQPTNFIKAHGLISVYYDNKWDKEIAPGDLIIARLSLKRPREATSQGTFNYKEYLKNKNILITGYIKYPVHLKKLHSEYSFFSRIKYYPEQLRVTINEVINSSVQENVKGIYQAILTGNRSGISLEIKEGFKDVGCFHILAISGLHVSILGVFLYAGIYWFCSRSERLMLSLNIRKLSALLCCPPLLFYGFIAGGNAPVLRSLIMAISVILALCVDRKKSALTIIGFAALLILIANPSSLFTPSFQLSFSAVIFIIFGAPIYKRILNQQNSVFQNIKNWMYSGITISVLATLGTTPLLLYYFNRVSIVGPISNLILEPLICFFTLPIGFIALPFMSISPVLSSLLFKIGSIGLIASLKALEILTLIPVTSIWLPTPHPLLIISYYLVVLYIYYLFKLKKQGKVTSFVFFAIVIILFIYPPRQIFRHFTSSAIISFIDVGQGSSTLFELPGGKNILIDGGSGYSESFNVGEHTIAPFLWSKGIRKIDHIIITHPHSDHFNGLPFILDKFNPRSLVINFQTDLPEEYEALLKKATDNRISFIQPNNSIIFKSEHYPLTLKYRGAGKIKGKETKERVNDESLVVSLAYGDFSMLFPGDIGKSKEEELIGQNLIPPSDVLLSPHHGSKSSSSKKFLETVDPELVIVSSSESKYFPSKEVTDLLYEKKIAYLETSKVGTITIETNGKGFLIKTTLPIVKD